MNKNYKTEILNGIHKSRVPSFGVKSLRGLLTVSAIAFLGFNAQAQTNIANYTFESSVNNTYVPITGGTVVFSGSYDDSSSSVINLPTTFTYGGAAINSLYISTNGAITFGVANSSSTPLSSTSTNQTGSISIFGQDGASSNAAGAAPEIRYEDLGTEFVVQYKDHANYYNRSTERLNFQIRLNYATGQINFIYGNCTAPGSSTSNSTPQVGIRGNSTTWNTNVNNLMIANIPVGATCDWSKAVAGSANSSTMVFSSSTNAAISIPNGLKFTWTPGTQAPVRTFAAPSNITNNSANLSWTAPTGASAYDVQYREMGQCDWVNFPTAVTTNSVALTGLNAYTTYQVRVKAKSATAEAMFSHLAGATASSNGYVAAGTFTTLAVCSTVPTAVLSSNVTTSGATLNWTAPSTAPSNGYEYYLSTTNTAPVMSTVPTGSVAAGVTNVVLNTLNSNTQYYFWVRSNCNGTDKSPWTSSVAFKTLCNSYPAPFAETFSTGAIPACWVNQNPTSTSTSANVLWKFTGAGDYGASTSLNGRAAGTYAFVDASSPYDGIHNVELLSPMINLSGLANPYVSFEWFKNHSTSATAVVASTYDDNKLTVDVNNGSGWVTIFQSTSNGASWRNEGIVLPASYVGSTIQLRFSVDKHVGANPYFYDDVLLDNIEVKEAPSCYPPNALTYNSLTYTGATISWTAPVTPPALGYDVYYTSTNTPPTATTAPTVSGHSSTSLSIPGVTGDAFYAWVRSSCSATSASTWIGPVNFIIPAQPPVNDDCAAAQLLAVNPDTNCTQVTAGTTLGATNSGVPLSTCSGSPDDDVWYKFVATSTAHIVSLSNVVSVGASSSTDMYMQVLSGACGSLTSIACSDPNTTTVGGLTIGDTYYVRVYTYYSGAYNANFNICISTPPPAPANADCGAAVLLPVGTTFAQNAVVGDNTYSFNSATSSCGSGGANNLWYKVEVPSSGNVTIETASQSGSSVTDTILGVYSGNCGTLTELQCNDDGSGIGLFSKVSLTGLTPGQIIYASVWGYSASDAGEFQVAAYDLTSLATQEVGAKSKNINLYPNPFTDVINISDIQKVKSLLIVDGSGKKIKTIEKPKSNIQLNDLVSGMYMVVLELIDGSQQTIKVIKK